LKDGNKAKLFVQFQGRASLRSLMVLEVHSIMDNDLLSGNVINIWFEIFQKRYSQFDVMETEFAEQNLVPYLFIASVYQI
jgi:hypothetical protein